jgi:hypothetical protein
VDLAEAGSKAMLTASARCCSAALTSTLLESTTGVRSHRPSVLRAVTVAPFPGPAALKTSIAISVGPVPATDTGVTGRAG